MAASRTFKFWVFAGSTFLLLLSACTTTHKTVELSEKEQKDYLQKGQMLAQQSFAALSGRLMAAIEQGGVPHAVKYCNVAALPLIDSLSNVHQANIRRTSLKIRNRQDVAQGWEKEVLEAYQILLAEGKSLRQWSKNWIKSVLLLQCQSSWLNLASNATANSGKPSTNNIIPPSNNFTHKTKPLAM